MDQDKKPMNAVIDWKSEIGVIAGPFHPTDTKQSWLSRAAKQCGVSLRYITSLYYGQTSDPKYSIANSILSAAEQARIEEARKDMKRLADIYQTAAGRLNEIDPNFHRNHVDALLAVVREFGALDRSRTKEGGQ